MTFLDVVLLTLAGLGSGIVGVVSGGASLISFPALLALGYTPLVANVTNTLGVSWTGIGAAIGYRKELKAERPLVMRLCIACGSGGLLGALLLLALGEAVFKAVVPLLLVVAAGLVLFQPLIVRKLKTIKPHRHGHMALFATFLCGIYGGYFGAGVGVMLVAIFGALLSGGLQRAIAFKGVVAFASNAAAIVVFALWGPIAYGAALVLAISSLCGGYVGTHLAKRLSDRLLRGLAVAAALLAAASAI